SPNLGQTKSTRFRGVTNDITKVIGKDLTSNPTFPFGTYLSYIFNCLSILTRGDPLMTTNHTLSFGALRYAGYKKDPLIGNWFKGVQSEPHKVDDNEVGGEHDDIPSPKVAPAATPSIVLSQSTPPQAQTFSANTLAILDAIGSLQDDFKGLNIRTV
ncbi:hypothetical protein J1N35_034314, partial [Gossypium stocksii]